MTLPYERTHAVQGMANAVSELFPYLVLSGESVKIPKELIQRITRCLRHYPGDLYLQMSHEHAPDIWGPVWEGGVMAKSKAPVKAKKKAKKAAC